MQFDLRRTRREREKELLSKIIAEAEDYKVDFYRRRKVNCKTNKDNNREKEKLFLASQEKFRAEADKNYWKAIAELVPNEDQEKKPLIVVVRGPKPGKPTDLSRTRQMLTKLKHNAPAYLRPSQPPDRSPTKDAKTGAAAATTPSKAASVATPVEAVAVA